MAEMIRARLLWTLVPGCCNALRTKKKMTNKTFQQTEENHTTQNNLHKESLLLMDHRDFVVMRVRFAVRDQMAGSADPQSPDAPEGVSHAV